MINKHINKLSTISNQELESEQNYALKIEFPWKDKCLVGGLETEFFRNLWDNQTDFIYPLVSHGKLPIYR